MQPDLCVRVMENQTLTMPCIRRSLGDRFKSVIFHTQSHQQVFQTHYIKNLIKHVLYFRFGNFQKLCVDLLLFVPLCNELIRSFYIVQLMKSDLCLYCYDCFHAHIFSVTLLRNNSSISDIKYNGSWTLSSLIDPFLIVINYF